MCWQLNKRRVGTYRRVLLLSSVLSAHQHGGTSIMTRHTPRWQFMQPTRKKRGREKLIMSVVCGGNGAMTFPDRGDISAIRVCACEALRQWKICSHTSPISETRKWFKIITKDRFYPKLQIRLSAAPTLLILRDVYISMQPLFQSIYSINLINLLFIKNQLAVIHVWYDGQYHNWSTPPSKALSPGWIQWSDSTESSSILVIILCFVADF